MSISASLFHSLAITEVRRETPSCVSLELAVPEPLRPQFAFTPGQYLTLRAFLQGQEVRRSYSICAGPGEALRVAIKHVPGGAFSHFANTALAPGDRIEAMPPDGRFGTRLASGTTLGIAAGSGITPILSILKATLAASPEARFVLLYGSRSTPEIIFRGELEDLKDRFLARLSVLHVLSREEQDVKVLGGRIDAPRLRALLPGLVAPAAIAQALVCGPGGMIAAVTTELIALGLDPARVQAERFTPSASAPAPPPPPAPVAPAPFATATIVYDGKTNDIPVAEGEPVLEAALRAGLDLPWSCRGGMCCTCRARLREGAVTMRENYSLEPWETEAGFILTCQAHPTTPHVTVDYDCV